MVGDDLSDEPLAAVLRVIAPGLDAALHGHLAALGDVLVAEVGGLPPRNDGQEIRLALALGVGKSPLNSHAEGGAGDAALGGVGLGIVGKIAGDDYLIDRSFLLFVVHFDKLTVDQFVPGIGFQHHAVHNSRLATGDLVFAINPFARSQRNERTHTSLGFAVECGENAAFTR